MFGAGARRGNDVWSDGAAWNSSVEVFIGCVRSVPRYRHIRNVPNCRRGRLPWQTPPPDVGSLRCRLLVGAQLVRLEGKRVDECVGGRLDGCRLRIVDVILGMHGQVLLDCVVDQVEVLSHASGR